MGLSRQSNTIVTALHNAHKLPQYVFTLCLRYVLLMCGIAVCKCWLLTVLSLVAGVQSGGRAVCRWRCQCVLAPCTRRLHGPANRLVRLLHPLCVLLRAQPFH